MDAKKNNDHKKMSQIIAHAAYRAVMDHEKWALELQQLGKMTNQEAAAKIFCDLWYQMSVIMTSISKEWLTPAQAKALSMHARDTVIVTLCTQAKENPIEEYKQLFDGLNIDDWVDKARVKIAEERAKKINNDIQNGAKKITKQS